MANSNGFNFLRKRSLSSLCLSNRPWDIFSTEKANHLPFNWKRDNMTTCVHLQGKLQTEVQESSMGELSTTIVNNTLLCHWGGRCLSLLSMPQQGRGNEERHNKESSNPLTRATTWWVPPAPEHQSRTVNLGATIILLLNYSICHQSINSGVASSSSTICEAPNDPCI
jgi:hypothetical protein